jgi:gamma-glutamylcyclotransferase (GGCT)/AIG2-like uncharacterized protein YtfP
LPLRVAEARAIISSYNVNWRSFSLETLTPSDVASLTKLRERIGLELENSDIFATSGAFLRLCGRSPKDGEPLNRSQVWSRYEQNLAGVRAEIATCTAPPHSRAVLSSEGNTKLIAASRTPTLLVESADEAMALLLSSERVFSDCRDWLSFGEPEQIVLREWDPRLRLEFEFRAFIHDNVITAISQYDHYCVYPSLAGREKGIEEAIKEFHSTMHDSVGVASYCADFACIPVEGCDGYEVTLVEISPFLPCTGPAMFHWDRDAEVLRGTEPFEFRLNTAVRHQIDELVTLTWEDRWLERHIERYDTNWEEICRPKNLLGRLANVFGAAAMPPPPPKQHLLFVYGTLKRNFQWHSKYMSECEFVGAGITMDRIALVVGDSGVPYCLVSGNGSEKRIVGEVYRVSEEELEGMDANEGVEKGHYIRRKVAVSVTGNPGLKDAWIYQKNSEVGLAKELKCIEEYTLEMHERVYRPIQHILVKQTGYLGGSVSTWGNVRNKGSELRVYGDAKS